MKCLRLAAYVLLVLCIAPTLHVPEARAQNPDPTAVDIKFGRDNGELQRGTLYLIKIKCLRTPNVRSGKRKAGLLVRPQDTASHFVIVTNKPIANPDNIAQLPTEALLVAFPFYSTDTVDFKEVDCGQTAVVRGDPALKLVAVTAFSESNVLDENFRTSLDLLRIGLPIAALLTGGSAPVAAAGAAVAGDVGRDAISKISRYIDGVSTFSGKYEDLVKVANKARKPIGQARPLHAGSYTIFSRFSDVRVHVAVEPISSLVIVKDYHFTDYFPDIVAKTISGEHLKQDCSSIDWELRDRGLNSVLDRAFVMLRLAGRAGLSKREILQCLGCPAAEAVSREDIVWGGLSDYPNRFTTDDVYNEFEGQCLKNDPCVVTYGDNTKNLMHRTVVGLGKARSSGVAALGTIFDDPIDVTDEAGGTDLGKVSPSDFVAKLQEMGITRFGCFGPAYEGDLNVGDGLNAAFLGFRVKENAGSACKRDAVLFRACARVGSEQHRLMISKIALTNNLGMIDALLGTRKSCGDLMIGCQ